MMEPQDSSERCECPKIRRDIPTFVVFFLVFAELVVFVSLASTCHDEVYEDPDTKDSCVGDYLTALFIVPIFTVGIGSLLCHSCRKESG